MVKIRLAMCLVVAILFVHSAEAAIIGSCDRPRFTGEVWAGAVQDPILGDLILYWVFDAGTFYEYVQFARTGELRLIATSQYFQRGDSYMLERSHTESRRVRGSAEADLVIELKVADAGLELGGNRLVRITDSQQWIPPLTRVEPVDEQVRALSENDDCCCACWRTHAFLGISFLNGICCFFNGGCDDASGFCGGGSGREF